jgi:hypothetical protein
LNSADSVQRTEKIRHGFTRILFGFAFFGKAFCRNEISSKAIALTANPEGSGFIFEAD